MADTRGNQQQRSRGSTYQRRPWAPLTPRKPASLAVNLNLCPSAISSPFRVSSGSRVSCAAQSKKRTELAIAVTEAETTSDTRRASKAGALAGAAGQLFAAYKSRARRIPTGKQTHPRLTFSRKTKWTTPCGPPAGTFTPTCWVLRPKTPWSADIGSADCQSWQV